MRGSRRTFALYVGLGIVAGLVYSATNRVIDVRTGFGTLPSSLEPLHTFVDQVLPVLIGVLLGIAFYALALRSQLVEAEKKRSEELRQRLAHTERDQAVWVLAAAVLHEVKNPLHSLGLLLDDAVTGDEGARTVAIERARGNVARIAARLDELGALSEGATPGHDRLTVTDLVREVADDLGPLASRHRIELSVRGDSSVVATGDASFARVILENLVENALDALREDEIPGTVQIVVGKGGGGAEVRVSDDGPGLDEIERAAVFQPLRSKKKGGLGLGLSISRKLARAMGGDLLYVDGEKRAFVLSLPLAREPS